MALLSAMAFASGASMTGYVVDEKCGAKGAHPGAEACAKKCAEAGEKMVFVTDSDKNVLKLDNPSGEGSRRRSRERDRVGEGWRAAH
jgi:hypothetical protein